MTDRPLRSVQAGRHEVRFVAKATALDTPKDRVPTPTGTMAVSTPEATALDLVRYARVAGHLDHVAGVVAELAERLDADRLTAAAGPAETAVVQRLGYLLTHGGREHLATGLARLVARRDPPRAPLVPELPRRGAVDPTWRIVVNAELGAEP